MRLKILGISILLLGVCGCDFSGSVQTQLKNSLNILWPQTEGLPDASASPSATVDEAGLKARTAKENSELFREMSQVVFQQDPTDRAEFGNWVDTLNQGASLEGVYNGLVHSADYRKLEETRKGSSAEALRAFGEELGYLEIELPQMTQFDMVLASPLPTEKLDPTPTPLPIDDGRKFLISPTPEPSAAARVAPIADRFSKQFVGASIFTLKRILGDEALKVVGSKTEYREKLAIWYSKWAVRVSQRNVDFGVALRNKQDEGFHFKWAVQSTEDRIKWEVLNRLHRILNEANKQKQ